jgi:hypothetical protein
MFARVRSYLSYGNVVATIALFCAVGGTSYAALTVTGKNVKDSSLTGADIKNSSLTANDVRDGTLLARDFRRGEIPAGAPGQQGPQGPQGPQGAKGDKGDKGNAGATSVTTRSAVTTVTAGNAGIGTANCLSGERATGGGAFATRNDGWISSSHPSGNPPTGWSVVFRSPVADAQLTVYVICAAP